MSKRSQTTGLPKNRQKAAPEAAKEGREHRSRAEREARIQRWVVIGTVATVAVIAVILIAAVVVELFITPSQVVASVNSDTITVSQFEKRVRLERALLNQQINGYIALIQAQGLDPNQFAGQEPLRTWLSQVQIPDQLGNTVINTMVEDLLTRQYAAENGITVTQEDIETQINDFFGFDPAAAGQPPTATPTPTITPTPFVSPTPSPEPTATPVPVVEETAEATAESTDAAEPTITPTLFPTLTPTATRTAEEETAEFNRQRDEFFAYLRTSARVTDDDINAYFEARAVRQAVSDFVASDIGEEALHVDARHILVATEEEALDIVAALRDGESFADLARAVSTDTGSGAQGGELGWTPVSGFVAPFAQAVADAPIGEIIGPVQTEFGWHVIQVRARENRPVSASQADSLKAQTFATWLEDRRSAEGVTINISSIWADHVPTDPAWFFTG